MIHNGDKIHTIDHEMIPNNFNRMNAKVNKKTNPTMILVVLT